MASELLGRGLGLRRPALSLQRSQGGEWGAVLRKGRRHFKPAAAQPQLVGNVFIKREHVERYSRRSRLKVGPTLPEDSAPFAPPGFSGG